MSKRGYPRNIGKLMPKVNRQAIELYGFIVRFFAEHSYMPSVREMCVFMDGRSTSIVEYHVNVLVGWEWIEREAKAGRGMRLIRSTERGLKPEELRTLLGLDVVALDPPPFVVRKDRNWKRHEHRKRNIRRQIRPFSG